MLVRYLINKKKSVYGLGSLGVCIGSCSSCEEDGRQASSALMTDDDVSGQTQRGKASYLS